MITLGEDALSKVKSGVTSVEELFRVVTEVKEVRTLCPGCQGVVGVDVRVWPACTAARPGRKQLRERRRKELPPPNVAEFKNTGR